jgi:catechol 2,3-dioxygenase-like lactoylglutathione lyase family enzyme
MSIVKAEDIAYVRFTAPDLDAMRAFLADFGLSEVPAGPGRLFARGQGEAPFLHATAEGPAGFQAVGFRLASVADLEQLAAAEGASIEALDAPGGGQVVRLVDPDGHGVEAVAGQALAEPLAPPDFAPWNDVRRHDRLRAVKRVPTGPARVQRLGHCVFNVADFRASERWYKDRFGFITSDEIALSPELSLGAFLRCDRGPVPTDHHTLFLAQAPSGPGFNHAAFEVADLDDLMRGHDHLAAAGRTPAWGVGRHLLGSQVFDYWRDPFGYKLEHWTDGDLFTADDGSNILSVQDLLAVQWGQPMPPTFA